MKKLLTIALALLLACGMGWAQSNVLGRIANRAKNAAENAISNKVENAVYKGIDKATSKKDKSQTNNQEENSREEVEEQPAEVQPEGAWTCPDCGATGNTGNFCTECGAKKPAEGAPDVPAKKKAETAYAKSDFVPGDEIIFEDTFEDEQVGEFPSKWDLDGGEAEVAVIDGRKVLMTGNQVTVFPLMKNPKDYLPDVFTVEWDMYFGGEDDPRTKVELGLMTDEPGVNSHNNFAAWLEIVSWFSWECRKPAEGSVNGSKYFDEIKDAVKCNDWNHIAVSFNKRAFKTYLNGVRVCNVPNMLAPKYLQFYIQGDTDNNYKGISNVRIAKGAVPLYDRLATDGKIITYAITFDTGKATLKPEADIEINRIKGLLDQDPSLKFEVQGHCDNTGSAAINQKLSQQRAEAIVNRLVEMGVNVSRLSAVGKGSSEPIADNSTDEGRARNRRVEFIRK